MTTFLDTNVVIALLDKNHADHSWAVEELDKLRVEGPAIVSDIVYCEFSMGMKSREEVDKAIESLDLERTDNPDDALFMAGLVYKKYRDDNKGPKLGVLPDFLIGATAEVAGRPLMTANSKDFVKYFPNLKLIEP